MHNPSAILIRPPTYGHNGIVAEEVVQSPSNEIYLAPVPRTVNLLSKLTAAQIPDPKRLFQLSAVLLESCHAHISRLLSKIDFIRVDIARTGRVVVTLNELEEIMDYFADARHYLDEVFGIWDTITKSVRDAEPPDQNARLQEYQQHSLPLEQENKQEQHQATQEETQLAKPFTYTSRMRFIGKIAWPKKFRQILEKRAKRRPSTIQLCSNSAFEDIDVTFLAVELPITPLKDSQPEAENNKTFDEQYQALFRYAPAGYDFNDLDSVDGRPQSPLVREGPIFGQAAASAKERPSEASSGAPSPVESPSSPWRAEGALRAYTEQLAKPNASFRRDAVINWAVVEEVDVVGKLLAEWTTLPHR